MLAQATNYRTTDDALPSNFRSRTACGPIVDDGIARECLLVPLWHERYEPDT